MNAPQTHSAREQTCQMLHELGVPARLHGYRQLRIAIPRFADDSSQALAKELYPYISHALGFPNTSSVERCIRCAIIHAWDRRDPEVWSKYFLNLQNRPTNKEFIATLAERLE